MSARLRVVSGGARGRTIAVTGGKGGVGKSTLALNLGLALAGRGEWIALVDTDLGAAGMSVLAGAPTGRGLRGVLDGDSVAGALTASHGAWLLTGSIGGPGLSRLGAPALGRALAAIDGLAAGFDTVIVDVAAGVGDEQAALAAAADERLVVVTPDPPSMAAAFACLEGLAARGVHRAFVVPNQVASAAQADDVAGRLRSLAGRVLDLDVSVLPAIPADPCVREAVLAAVPVFVRRPDSPAAHGIDRIRLALTARAASESRPLAPQSLAPVAPGASP